MSTTPEQPARKPVLPSEYMKGRRPEQFSDSVVEEVATLDRGFLEYHLDSLTSRSEEKPFEHFARKLAQREICPNLLPQTGPTGGGDSKVDTETYPVAGEVSERWYEGEQNAGTERWAFAVSAKKDWRSKLKSDIEKIVKVGRGYKVAYFISNQYIRDKDRSDLEDSLSLKHGLTVRILDRSWILERVFENGHIELAIDSLNIAVAKPTRVTRGGVLDGEKRARLLELENQITDQDRYQGVEYQLVEDCLEAAVVSRELELSRVEVDGRFRRAERLAAKYPAPGQELRVFYQWAWTTYFWFDDFAELNRLYDKVELLALESDLADDIERPANLWNGLLAGVAHGILTQESAQLEARAQRLRDSLVRLSSDVQRPNNAAHAGAMLCLLDLTTSSISGSEDVANILLRLAEIFRSADHLPGFPFDQYVQIFTELGSLVGEQVGYDEAFEVILPLIERRRSDIEGGRALLKRGLQKLEAKLPYDAIRLLGRAQPKLSKKEYQDTFIRCLAATAFAYQNVGLLWAANGVLTAAFVIAHVEFRLSGRFNPQALSCLEHMTWLELQQGRLPQFLLDVEMAHVLASQLQLEEEDLEHFKAFIQEIDFELASLFARSDASQIDQMSALEKSLAHFGLNASGMTLLYATGHLESLRSEQYIPADTSAADLEATMLEFSSRPCAEGFSEQPFAFNEETVTLKSNLLGCEWRVSTPNTNLTLYIAEAILGFVEAFFATSLQRDVAPHRQTVDIGVRVAAPGIKTDGVKPGLQIVTDATEYLACVDVDNDYNPSDEAVTGGMRELLLALVKFLIPKTIFVKDASAYLTRIFEEEEALGRCLAYANYPAYMVDHFGSADVASLSQWNDESGRLARVRPGTELPLTRAAGAGARGGLTRPGVGRPPEEFLDPERLQHRQRRVFSVIEADLWHAALWSAVTLITSRSEPPVLVLAFTNRGPAEQIFAKWFKQYDNESEPLLRIAIVKGVHAANPHSWRVVVGSDMDLIAKSAQPFDEFVMTSKSLTSNSTDPTVLDAFMRAYGFYGGFRLAAGHMSADGRSMTLLRENAFLMRRVVVKEAWTITEHDPDVTGLREEDEVFVPPGVIDPPYLKALAARQLRQRKP
ncbi:hypothetical protein [Acidisphaera sp. L21]|uniref:hypothetical protein n=1 Tax=Acidisphaera sp. L21 TaxID=1641851 RepID=UPI00131C335C|nr:hypothetical protein [Acidisphaera sp. L21]